MDSRDQPTFMFFSISGVRDRAPESVIVLST